MQILEFISGSTIYLALYGDAIHQLNSKIICSYGILNGIEAIIYM